MRMQEQIPILLLNYSPLSWVRASINNITIPTQSVTQGSKCTATLSNKTRFNHFPCFLFKVKIQIPFGKSRQVSAGPEFLKHLQGCLPHSEYFVSLTSPGPYDNAAPSVHTFHQRINACWYT